MAVLCQRYINKLIISQHIRPRNFWALTWYVMLSAGWKGMTVRSMKAFLIYSSLYSRSCRALDLHNQRLPSSSVLVSLWWGLYCGVKGIFLRSNEQSMLFLCIFAGTNHEIYYVLNLNLPKVLTGFSAPACFLGFFLCVKMLQLNQKWIFGWM